ncbi:hypothetical protein PG984_014643 [Apiospora sp. TS-2023a]
MLGYVMLPAEATNVVIEPHGDGTWSRTANINAEADGEPVAYFLKVTDTDSGATTELYLKGLSADGLYGADEAIAGGVLPVRSARSNSWEDSFFRYMRVLMRLEEIAQGPRYVEFTRILDALFNRIIPRLLRPLETSGREIVPRLIHTDLWDGNMATDPDGNPRNLRPSLHLWP